MTFSNKNSNIMRVIFFALILILIVVLVISINKNKNPTPAESDPSLGQTEPTEPILAPEIDVAPPAVTTKPSVSGDPIVPQDASASPSPSVPAFSPDVPEQTAAEDDFFSDAAFMGNSLMDGFRLFSGLTTCDYYAATSMTVLGADENVCITLDNGNSGTLVDGLLQKPYGKIYILLGINEIGYDVDTFIGYYSTLLDTIKAGQPDCDIYVMGLTPVSAAKSAGSDTFNMTRINSYNEGLYELAAEKGCYYLDLVSALAGSDGYLPADVTTDGVHFSAEVYQQWLGYVKTHYVK